jgi:hypothetical protein
MTYGGGTIMPSWFDFCELGGELFHIFNKTRNSYPPEQILKFFRSTWNQYDVI